jgi:transposase
MTMLPIPRSRHKRAGCFAPLPWHPLHPQWLAIDAELPHDHLARFIDQAVGQLDLEALFADYGGTGSLPYPPDRLLAAVLFRIQRGQHSPAQWLLDSSENAPTRWLLRGLKPSRSCWYNFRDRIAPFVDDLLRQILQQALDAGISPAERGSLDGTSIAANASRRKLVNETVLGQRLALLDQAVAADQNPPALPPPADLAADNTAVAVAPAAPATTSPASGQTLDPDPAGQAALATPPATQAQEAAPRLGWMAPTVRGRQRQQRRLHQAQQRMEQLQGRNSNKRSSKRSKRAKVVVSPSDPEAALGLDKDKIFRPLYNVQLVQDLDSPLVLSYEVFAQPNDAGLLLPMLQKTKALSGQRLAAVLVDSAYAGGAELAAAVAEGTTVYAGLPKESKQEGKKLSKSQFTYVAEEDIYVCPQGKRLEHRETSKEKRSSVELVVLHRYRAAAADCRACPRQPECTTSTERGRTIRRSEHEELVAALRQRMQTQEAKALYRLRGQTVELANADFKEHRKLRRFSARGLKRVRCQIGLMVLVHNLLVVRKHQYNASKDDAQETDRNHCSTAA